MNQQKPWWAPIAHFLAHTTVGTAIFIIIAAPAIALGEFVHTIPEWIWVPQFTLTVLTWLEEVVVSIDSLLFLAYLLKTGYAAVREDF